MAVIFRYPLMMGMNKISMPEGHDVLHFAGKNDELSMWALVNPLDEQRTHQFYVSPTGVELPNGIGYGAYVGTALIDNDRFVAHLFELGVLEGEE